MNLQRALVLMLLALAPSVQAADESSWLDDGRQWVQQLWRDDAQEWLDRIDDAVLNHNYSGVIVFAQGASLDALAVEHRMQDGVETLKLRTLSGVPRELVKRGGRIQTDTLGGGPSASGPISAQAGFSQLANAKDNKWYRTALAGKGRIAGRPARIVEITAEDKWRYSYRLWLDEQTALPLKVVTLDERGDGVEQMVFTQIRITPAAKPAKAATARAPKALDNPFKDVKGYRLIARQSTAASTHYLYSDGLSSISLYIEPSKRREKSQMHKDAVNGLMFGDGRTRYVVLGKAPVATLERVLAAARN